MKEEPRTPEQRPPIPARDLHGKKEAPKKVVESAAEQIEDAVEIRSSAVVGCLMTEMQMLVRD